MDRTKVLHGPRTQTYGETNYLEEKTEFWTEPRYCMVLGLKPMGKPITYQCLSSFGQNQGIAWSSDSNLWGKQLLKEKIMSFGQNQGIAWSSDSNLWGNQLLKENLNFGQN